MSELPADKKEEKAAVKDDRQRLIYIFTASEIAQGVDSETEMMFVANELGLQGLKILGIREEMDQLTKDETYTIYYREGA